MGTPRARCLECAKFIPMGADAGLCVGLMTTTRSRLPSDRACSRFVSVEEREKAWNDRFKNVDPAQEASRQGA